MSSHIPPVQPFPAAPSEQPGPPGPGSLHGPPQPRVRRGWDVTLTCVLLVCGAPCALAASYFGLFGFMASDGCYDDQRCSDAVGTGALILVAAPLVCWVLALVVSVALLLTRRLAFWVPLVAVVVWLVAVLAGGLVLSSGVG